MSITAITNEEKLQRIVAMAEMAKRQNEFIQSLYKLYGDRLSVKVIHGDYTISIDGEIDKHLSNDEGLLLWKE